ncbi:MAG: ion transporter [Bacteroidota bacterium]
MRTYLKIEKLAPIVIILSVLLLTLESIFHSNQGLNQILFYADLVILLFFVIEMWLRVNYFPFDLKHIFGSIRHVFLKERPDNAKDYSHDIINRYRRFQLDFGVEDEYELDLDFVSKVCLEQFFWLMFDLIITISSLAAIFFINLFPHPEIITLFRVVRVFRIIRIFEVHKSLKQTERKIMSVIPTVFVFAILLALIHFVYAIIGCNLYSFTKFEEIDFSNLYNAYFGLFLSLTNGWASMHSNLLNSDVPGFITDIYCISFFVFSSMITLNVFLAVMTTQIQDKLNDEKKASDNKEKQLIEIIQNLVQKIDRLEKKINEPKEK